MPNSNNHKANLIFVVVRLVALVVIAPEALLSGSIAIVWALSVCAVLLVMAIEFKILGFYSQSSKRASFFVAYALLGFVLLLFAVSANATIDNGRGWILVLAFLVCLFSCDNSDFFSHRLSLPVSIVCLIVSVLIAIDKSYSYENIYIATLYVAVLFLAFCYVRIAPIGDVILYTAILLFVVAQQIELVFILGFVTTVALAFIFSKKAHKELPLIPLATTPLVFGYAFSILSH